MYNKLSGADLEQLFLKSLFLYKGKPVKIQQVGLKSFLALDLMSQKTITIPAPFENISPEVPRIGNVNILGNVCYVVRNTPRKFSLGIAEDNVGIKFVGEAAYESKDESYYKLKTLDRKEIALSMLENYPTFEEACQQVAEKSISVAFDHQFSIGFSGKIYYKTLPVGSYDLGSKDHKLENIVFYPTYEYLSELLKEYRASKRTNKARASC